MPLLLVSLGGLISERVGILNISLEGLMLSSAFFALYTAQLTSSTFLGLLGGIVASLILTLLFILGAIVLKGDPFVTGLGINLLSFPLISWFSQVLFKTEGTVRPEQMGHGVGFFPLLTVVLILLTLYLLELSPQGLVIKLCGQQPDRLKQKGINPEKIRVKALLLCAVLTGAGGAILSLDLGVYVPGMSAGKGWIALVAVYLGGRRWGGVLLAVLVFTLFDYMSISFQGFDSLPADLMLGVPYFLTLLVLLGVRVFGGWFMRIKQKYP